MPHLTGQQLIDKLLALTEEEKQLLVATEGCDCLGAADDVTIEKAGYIIKHDLILITRNQE